MRIVADVGSLTEKVTVTDFFDKSVIAGTGRTGKDSVQGAGQPRVCTGLKFELSPARQKILQNLARLAYESQSQARSPARLTVRMLHEFLFIPSPVLTRTVM